MSKKNNKIISINCPKMNNLIKNDTLSRIRAALATDLSLLRFEPSELPAVAVSVDAVIEGKQVCLKVNLEISQSGVSYKIDFPDTISDQEAKTWFDQCGNNLQELIFQKLS